MTEMYKMLDYSYMVKHKEKEKEKLLQIGDFQEKKIAVLCGSTFGETQDFLELFLLYYGIKPHFFIGEYNRYFEEAYFENSDLKDFSPDIILLHVTNRNLLKSLNDIEISKNEETRKLCCIWKSLKERYNCIIIQNNFEYYLYRIIGNSARTYEKGIVKYIDDINRVITEYARDNLNFYINDINFLSSYLGLKNWYDNRMWGLYKYPISMSALPRYALNIANIIKSTLGKNKKTIITDLDNTLWGGEIGEIGIEKIAIGNESPRGEMFEHIHKYLKYLSNQGVILNICSKNEYEVGISGIQASRSILKESDFTEKRINWNDKATNIIEILKELNLLQDSALFVDDNQVECDNVSSMLPEVETIQMTEVNSFLEEMDSLSFFELTNITKEDEVRNRYYIDNALRSKEKKLYASYEEFLQGLQMVCHVNEICDSNIDRAVQLFNKTNQFNFMTNRYTLNEMKNLIQRSDIKTFVLDLEDKFGSNGIVSIAIIREEENDVYIVDWIMSCRVFERKLENVMLGLICKYCEEKNISRLHGYYKQTKKNVKVANFYKLFGFEKKDVNKKEREELFTEWICRDINSLLEICNDNSILVEEEENV